MEKNHTVTAEQALDIVLKLLDTVEISGSKNIRSMAQALDLIGKVKEFVHEDPKPEEEPVVELVQTPEDPEHK